MQDQARSKTTDTICIHDKFSSGKPEKLHKASLGLSKNPSKYFRVFLIFYSPVDPTIKLALRLALYTHCRQRNTFMNSRRGATNIWSDVNDFYQVPFSNSTFFHNTDTIESDFNFFYQVFFHCVFASTISFTQLKKFLFKLNLATRAAQCFLFPAISLCSPNPKFHTTEIQTTNSFHSSFKNLVNTVA